MNSSASLSRQSVVSPTSAPSQESILHAIDHASHLLPAQGPITAFVHHNTLHAFEDFGFDSGVRKGGKLFGCHPYLPEKNYREMLTTGRIRNEDIEAVLHEHLEDRASDLLGFLGTRFSLYRAILGHALHDGASVDLRWVIGDSRALSQFRSDTRDGVKEQFINDTRHWVMRDLRLQNDSTEIGESAQEIPESLRARYQQLFGLFDIKKIESWSETKWESFVLHLLWKTCEEGAERSHAAISIFAPEHLRHRDCLLDLTCDDTDELVHDMLIPFCAAFLDQGFSSWPLAERDKGFFASFLSVHGSGGWLVKPWQRGLATELQRHVNHDISPAESIAQSLVALGVNHDELDTFIEDSLLALRGFAGMLWQLESRGDRVSRAMPKGTLVEYLAIRLILDRMAVGHVASSVANFTGEVSELRPWVSQQLSGRHANGTSAVQRTAFRLFELAQLLDWRPRNLAKNHPAEWNRIVSEVNQFSGMERRQIYHLAYERKFRNELLDAVAVHVDRTKKLNHSNATSKPVFQIVCCIDDREESFRRYIEEIEPASETFAAAGFFAVPMYYRGAADASFLPLCPAVVIPKHYVREEVAYSLKQSAAARRKIRRTIGTITQRVHVGSRTFTAGWFGTAILGTLATFPLVLRVLFPRFTAKFKTVIGSLVRPPEMTSLQIERAPSESPGPEAHQLGLTVAEMAVAVERLMRDMSSVDGFSDLFFVCGHGSSSLNNPHEAAYNCGACAGGRGGPNARAFAQMANDRRVRHIVTEHGIDIPETTHFVGCYHNTCDDSIGYYDLDAIPTSHREAFETACAQLLEASKRNAHERCRRFESAPLDLTYDEALIHVEGRAEDLSQARPEYNHATNAICLVGRRAWSRGLYLDRRAFLQSYDPELDDADNSILERVLQAVIPVCAGINLEYYFSCIDYVGYGAGNKLPHNITSLVGVMDGAKSDLRPGLYCQMTEIHEPMRLVFIIETTESAMRKIISQNEAIRKLVEGDWVQLATLDTDTLEIKRYRNGEFETYKPETQELSTSPSSVDWYRGWRDHLKFASVGKEFGEQHES